MDAMPLTHRSVGWSAQLAIGENACRTAASACGLPHRRHGDRHRHQCRRALSAPVRRPAPRHTGLRFRQADNLFEGIAAQDAAVLELSGQHVRSQSP